MPEQEEKLLAYFKKYGINLEENSEFKNNKKYLLNAAQETIRLLESYTEEELKTEVIQKMLDFQLEKK